jgi:hypothetical protein
MLRDVATVVTADNRQAAVVDQVRLVLATAERTSRVGRAAADPQGGGEDPAHQHRAGMTVPARMVELDQEQPDYWIKRLSS